VWHAHQLCPSDYTADCLTAFGKVLRHTTQGLDKPTLADAYAHTLERHRAAYGSQSIRAKDGVSPQGPVAGAPLASCGGCTGGGGGGGRAGGTESAAIGGADPAQQAQQPDSGADWTNEASPRLPSAHEVEASPWHTQGTPSTDGTSAAWKDNVLVDTFPVDSDGGDSGGDGDGGGDGGCGGCGD
jgi:hypothetical protein